MKNYLNYMLLLGIMLTAGEVLADAPPSLTSASASEYAKLAQMGIPSYQFQEAASVIQKQCNGVVSSYPVSVRDLHAIVGKCFYLGNSYGYSGDRDKKRSLAILVSGQSSVVFLVPYSNGKVPESLSSYRYGVIKVIRLSDYANFVYPKWVKEGAVVQVVFMPRVVPNSVGGVTPLPPIVSTTKAPAPTTTINPALVASFGFSAADAAESDNVQRLHCKDDKLERLNTSNPNPYSLVGKCVLLLVYTVHQELSPHTAFVTYDFNTALRVLYGNSPEIMAEVLAAEREAQMIGGLSPSLTLPPFLLYYPNGTPPGPQSHLLAIVMVTKVTQVEMVDGSLEAVPVGRVLWSKVSTVQ